ncbi:hypothetical protein KC323_g29 [Hortaea werneckii]|nr:hypothetical protein KC323_g29 [Hortaea werneckii]
MQWLALVCFTSLVLSLTLIERIVRFALSYKSARLMWPRSLLLLWFLAPSLFEMIKPDLLARRSNHWRDERSVEFVSLKSFWWAASTAHTDPHAQLNAMGCMLAGVAAMMSQSRARLEPDVYWEYDLRHVTHPSVEGEKMGVELVTLRCTDLVHRREHWLPRRCIHSRHDPWIRNVDIAASFSQFLQIRFVKSSSPPCAWIRDSEGVWGSCAWTSSFAGSTFGS